MVAEPEQKPETTPMAMRPHWLDEIYSPGDSADDVLAKLTKRSELREAVERGLEGEKEAAEQQGKPGWGGPTQGQSVRGEIQQALADEQG